MVYDGICIKIILVGILQNLMDEPWHWHLGWRVVFDLAMKQSVSLQVIVVVCAILWGSLFLALARRC